MTQTHPPKLSSQDHDKSYITATDIATTGSIYSDPGGFDIDDLAEITIWVPEIGTSDGGARFVYSLQLSAARAPFVFVLAEYKDKVVSPIEHEEPMSDGSRALLVADSSGSPQAETVTWIKEATELPFERIAKLADVSRQTLDLWRRHGRISDDNRQRLLAVREVLERAQSLHPTPDALATWLDTPRGQDGVTPAQWIERGDINRARLLAISTPSPTLVQLPRYTDTFLPSSERLPSSEDALPPDHSDPPFAQTKELWHGEGASETKYRG